MNAAGVPKEVMDLIPNIIDTCRECRVWQSIKPDVKPSVTLTMKQDINVEADILFYKEHLIWQMLDQADRWHAATLITNKQADTLLEALHTCWWQIFGPFKVLITDGESGLMTDQIIDVLKSKGIEHKVRAPGQHARHIERRGAVLRHALHCIEEDLNKEGVAYTMPMVLADAVFAGNSLISHGGATPYNARFGKQPIMLPDLQAQPEEGAERGRDLQRMREIALQKIVEATAISRINRAMKTRTSIAGEALELRPNELVDFHRPPSQKDLSGWHGPARVLENMPEKGQVAIEWNKKVILVRYPDVRRFMAYFVDVFAVTQSSQSPVSQALRVVERFLADLSPNKLITLGSVWSENKLLPTKDTKQHANIVVALNFVARHAFQLNNVVTVRIGRGIRKLSVMPNYDACYITAWNEDVNDAIHVEAEEGTTLMNDLLGSTGDSDNRVIQFLCKGDAPEAELGNLLKPEGHLADHITFRDERPEPSSQLETIPEEDDDESEDLPTEDEEAYVSESIKYLLGETREELHLAPEPYVQPANEQFANEWEHQRFTPDAERDDAGNQYIAIDCPGHTRKLVSALQPGTGEIVTLRAYVAGTKKDVIETDTDLLTNEEYQQNRGLVKEAVQSEFQTWIDHKCFERRPRQGVRNLLDVRWVGKWKYVKDPKANDSKKRIIRMRLTLRGFKDRDAGSLATFAGTSSRVGQRIIVSEAVNHGWKMTAIDVKKAFLKGVTYQELAKETKEPLRDVSFELDHDSVEVLKTFPGYGNFDPRREVLHMLRPGTGCVDAPRCWSLKLTKATNDLFGAKPTKFDDQLIVRHDRQGNLDFIASKHVDDIKVACSPAVLEEFIKCLETVFGKGELDITRDEFTCCGVKHTPKDDGTYVMDQIHYIQALKPIVDNNQVGKDKDDDLNEAQSTKFLSLLMALAYALQTRPDLAVFVNALQRVVKAPKILHTRRLNALVRYAQRYPLGLTYPPLKSGKVLTIHSDSGFRKEDDDGIFVGKAMRGCNVMRVDRVPDAKSQVRCHLLDWSCGMLKVVARSTFAAETQAMIAAIDSGLALALTLHEIQVSPVTPRVGMELLEQGGMQIEIHAATDAMNLLTSIQAERARTPTERLMLCQLLWIREICDKQILTALTWLDTRDMTADGHTKGSISRGALISVMQGSLEQEHPGQSRRAKGAAATPTFKS